MALIIDSLRWFGLSDPWEWDPKGVKVYVAAATTPTLHSTLSTTANSLHASSHPVLPFHGYRRADTPISAT